MEKRNEELLNSELIVLDFLLKEYKLELSRTTKWYNGKIYKSVRKSRLKRLRLELDNVLKCIENSTAVNAIYQEVEGNE